MIPRRRMLIALVMASAALGGAQTRPHGARTQAAAPAAVYTIAGVVRDSISGDAVARASISLIAEDHETVVTTTQTDGEGHFRVPDLPAGRYGLMAARRGYRSILYNQHDNYSSAIVTGPGQETEQVDFRLPPDAVLRGTVTDEAGEPVVSAQVTLVRRSNSGGMGERFEQVAGGSTDDQGGFEFWNLAPGSYFVAVRGTPWYATHIPSPKAKLTPEQQAAQAALDVAYPVTYYDGVTEESAAAPIQLAEGDRQEITIALQAVAAGRVRLHIDQPWNGSIGDHFPVPMQTIFGRPEPVSTFGAISNDPSTGTAEIAGFAPGHYTLYQPATQRTAILDVSGATPVDVNAATAPAAPHVDVTVRMADGSALPNPLALSLASTISDAAAQQPRILQPGHFRFDNVQPGEWLLNAASGGSVALNVVALEGRTAMHPGSRFAIRDKSLALTAVLEQGSIRVSGIALRDGKPLAGVMIVLVPEDPASNLPLFRRDQSDSDGSFNLLNAVPGRYTVVAIEDGWPLDWARPEVLARYLPHGESVLLTRGSAKLVSLPAPVAVQPRQ